ncbi:MAG: response regulator transcription factor [Deferribacteres bacterium]|nr:response regulator transcription factor [candidate division KSB1 bacterium]MCB9512450.1 response regulator transcription factor [Deferribacteres bacterium]
MRILVVEDEEKLASHLKNILEDEHYLVDIGIDGRIGLDLALSEEYDLIILDVLLPRVNGFKILHAIRHAGIMTPVLMMTVKAGVDDIVHGLDRGADDYLSKPFALPVLLARVRALLRRSGENTSATLGVGDLELDTERHQVHCSEQRIELTPKEYAILEFLLYNKNRVVSRLSIAEHVWGDNFDLFSMTNFVDVHIKNLRKKISDETEKKIIQTVHGIGYTIKDES